MTQAESAVTRFRRPVLLVDHRDWDRAPVATAALEAALLPRTLPNVDRVRVHLAGNERFDGLIVPGELGDEAVSTLVRGVRNLRPTLPILIVAGDDRTASRLEERLVSTDADACVAAPRSERELRAPLARIFRRGSAHEVAPPSPDREAA